jgi:hypothetical protein
MNKTIPIAILANLLLLAACGRAPDDTAALEAAGKDSGAIAPAIIAPGEVADPAAPPSYEVAIASAAADRNQALERCAAQPERMRTQCEQEANAAFAEIEAGLQDLRGNQQ